MVDQAAQPPAVAAAQSSVLAPVPVIIAASLDPGRDRQLFFQQLNALGPFTGDKEKSLYE
jgi:hypothetical protein